MAQNEREEKAKQQRALLEQEPVDNKKVLKNSDLLSANFLSSGPMFEHSIEDEMLSPPLYVVNNVKFRSEPGNFFLFKIK